MKAGALFSAGAWAAMAIMLAGAAVPANAADRPERSGEHRGAGRAYEGGMRAQRAQAQRAPTPHAQPQRAPMRDRTAPAMRADDPSPRNWGDARARIMAERQRAQAEQRQDSGNRADNPARTWTRGNDGDRNAAWRGRDGGSRDGSEAERGRDSRNDGGSERWRGDRNDQRGDDRRDNDWRNNDRGQERWRGDSWRNDRRGNDARNDRDHRDSRRDYRHDDRRDWDRDRWRRDNRYDWRRYRDSHRSVYRIGRYYAPYRGYAYRRIGIGFTLGSMFYGNRYWIGDPWEYRLPAVYGPYRWVRYYDDVLLVNIYTGQVVDVIYDFFW